MNWVRNNRFLAAFLAVLFVVGGGLTFLLVTAQGRYSDVSNQYQSQVAELQRLQKLSMYPDENNLKKYEEVRKTYQQDVTSLQTNLAALDPAPANPPLTPLQFQDKLRQAVEETAQKAKSAGVTLPDGFYLGFEQYLGAPPDTAATPLLTVQLGEVQNLVDLLINKHVEKLTSVKRGLLPQEAGGAAAPRPRRFLAAPRSSEPLPPCSWPSTPWKLLSPRCPAFSGKPSTGSPRTRSFTSYGLCR